MAVIEWIVAGSFWFTVTAIIDFYKSPSKLHIALKKLMKTQLQKQAH